MQIELDDLVWALGKVTEINEQYAGLCLDKTAVNRDIDLLQDICAQYLNRPVEVFELRLEETRDPSLKAMFVAHNSGKYDIYRRPGLSPKEVRFVTCKELFHVILDEAQSRSLEITKNLAEMSSTFNLVDHKPSRAVLLEVLAEIAAVEFMYPFERRNLDLAQNAQIDSVLLSNRYGLPQRFVEMYLQEGIMQALAEAMPPPEQLILVATK